MRKSLFLLLLILVITLSGCDKESPEIIPEDTSCSVNQEEIDGQCYDLTGTQIQLRNAINDTKEVDNYSMSVHILNDDLDYSIEIDVTDTITRMVYDAESRTEYFKKNIDGTCEYKELYRDVLKTDTVTCSSSTDFSFFKSFEYSWFELKSGTFHIKSDKLSTVSELFNFNSSNMTITDVELATASNLISDIVISVDAITSSYEITIEIRNIDGVQLEWEAGDVQ